jgi:hypothetical protein
VPTASKRPPKAIIVTAEANQAPTLEGTQFELEVRVRNQGDVIVRNYRGGQAFDFWIEDASGDVIWVWSQELAEQRSVFTQELRAEIFAPGETKRGRAIWRGNTCADMTPGSVPPGTYKLRALWMSSRLHGGGGDERSWWSAPVTIEF